MAVGVNLQNSANTHLPFAVDGRYAFSADANSLARGESLKANADNRTFSVMRYFYVRRKPSYAQIMVGRDRGALRLAGFISASLSTLLRLTTPFESGLVRLINFANEAAAMVATPTQTHPKYQYRFMALDRTDRQAKPCKIIIEATSEHEARKVLAPHYILSLSAVLPIQEVRHA